MGWADSGPIKEGPQAGFAVVVIEEQLKASIRIENLRRKTRLLQIGVQAVSVIEEFLFHPLPFRLGIANFRLRPAKQPLQPGQGGFFFRAFKMFGREGIFSDQNEISLHPTEFVPLKTPQQVIFLFLAVIGQNTLGRTRFGEAFLQLGGSLALGENHLHIEIPGQYIEHFLELLEKLAAAVAAQREEVGKGTAPTQAEAAIDVHDQVVLKGHAGKQRRQQVAGEPIVAHPWALFK
jgi:hypothetical protein